MLDLMTCAIRCGTASVTTQNYAFTAYCLPCVLRASLTICAAVTTRPYQSVVRKDINVAFPALAYKLAL